jgi:AraC family transcriptional regulator
MAVGLVAAIRTKAPPLYAETAAVYLATHLATIAQHTEHAAHGSTFAGLSDRRLSRVIEYIRSNLAEPISLRALSAEASLSRFHFVRAFKQRTGSSPIEYVVKLRMEHAYSLLLRGSTPIAAIARQCGYATPAAFSNAVRRYFGASPAALRRRR